jgi:hypothetical protein
MTAIPVKHAEDRDYSEDGGPAYPSTIVTEHHANGAPKTSFLHEGMSLRDHFAAQIVSGYIAATAPGDPYPKPDEAADYAYDVADAMLRARAL